MPDLLCLGEPMLEFNQQPAPPDAPPGAPRLYLEAHGGDTSNAAVAAALLGEGPVAVFHLASVVSGMGERDFDLALRVNLDGARHLLEACRAHPHPVRLTTTSSLAVFGPASGDPVSDDSLVQPATTYGMTKAMLELMINDYSRKGYLDGRAARLPTVIIRPGAPNAAASSAASATVTLGRSYIRSSATSAAASAASAACSSVSASCRRIAARSGASASWNGTAHSRSSACGRVASSVETISSILLFSCIFKLS